MAKTASSASSGAEKNPTEQSQTATTSKLDKIKSRLLCTGLEDYGFWWAEMLKEQAKHTDPAQPFQRGRIWS